MELWVKDACKEESNTQLRGEEDKGVGDVEERNVFQGSLTPPLQDNNQLRTVSFLGHCFYTLRDRWSTPWWNMGQGR